MLTFRSEVHNVHTFLTVMALMSQVTINESTERAALQKMFPWADLREDKAVCSEMWGVLLSVVGITLIPLLLHSPLEIPSPELRAT